MRRFRSEEDLPPIETSFTACDVTKHHPDSNQYWAVAVTPIFSIAFTPTSSRHLDQKTIE